MLRPDHLDAPAVRVRRVLEVGALSSDGANLSQLTMIPRTIWYLLWLAVSLGALALGGKMLVMPN